MAKTALKMKKQKTVLKETVKNEDKNQSKKTFSYDHICYIDGFWKSRRDGLRKAFKTKQKCAIYFSDFKE